MPVDLFVLLVFLVAPMNGTLKIEVKGQHPNATECLTEARDYIKSVEGDRAIGDLKVGCYRIQLDSLRRTY